MHRTVLAASAPRLLIAAGALSAAMLGATAAHAQAIHKCRVDGRMVYQSSICPAEPMAPAAAKAGPTPAPVAVATTNPVGPKKKSLADLLRERDGAAPAAPAAPDAQGDGANVLRSRMGAV